MINVKDSCLICLNDELDEYIQNTAENIIALHRYEQLGQTPPLGDNILKMLS